MVLLDVLAPQRVFDEALVLVPDIEQRQLCSAPKLLADEDVGDDGGTIDQMMLNVVTTRRITAKITVCRQIELSHC